EVLSNLAGDEDDRKKDYNERECRRHNGQADFIRRLSGRFTGCDTLFLDISEYVFQNDDGVVDDNTGCQRESEEGHVVQGEIKRLHDREGCDQRYRNGGCRNNGAPDVAQEQKYDKRSEKTAEDQVVLNIFNRAPDEN